MNSPWSSHSRGVFSFGLPLSVSFPFSMSCFFIAARGPWPQRILYLTGGGIDSVPKCLFAILNTESPKHSSTRDPVFLHNQALVAEQQNW